MLLNFEVFNVTDLVQSGSFICMPKVTPRAKPIRSQPNRRPTNFAMPCSAFSLWHYLDKRLGLWAILLKTLTLCFSCLCKVFDVDFGSPLGAKYDGDGTGQSEEGSEPTCDW